MWEKDSFATGLQDEFVFVYLDFPRSDEAKARVPDPERNETLRLKYGVDGFPTVLLLDAEGFLYARTGYKEGGPESYVKDVKSLVEPGKRRLAQFDVLLEAYEAAEDKAMIIEEALTQVTAMKPGEVGADKIALLVRKAYEVDAENATGLKLRAVKALVESGFHLPADEKLARALDPDNEEGLLEKLIFGGMTRIHDDATANAFVDEFKAFLAIGKVHDKSKVQRACVAVVGMIDRLLDRPEDAKLIARKAKEFGELQGRAKLLVERILAEESD